MEISKKEILAKLYCIKAGLSAISLEKDKLSQEESNCAKIHQEMDDNQKKRKIAIDSLNKVEQDIKIKEKRIFYPYSGSGRPYPSQDKASRIWYSVYPQAALSNRLAQSPLFL